MSIEVVSPLGVANLLARTAEYVSSLASTHICDSAQVLWSDVQAAPVAVLHLATPDKRILGRGKRPVSEFRDFPEGKLHITTHRGGKYLLAEQDRPVASEALHCLGGLVGAIATDCPVDIFRACVSDPDAYVTEKTKLTIEAVLPEAVERREQVAGFLGAYGTSLQSHDTSYDILVPHHEIGRPARLYAVEFSLYPLD